MMENLNQKAYNEAKEQNESKNRLSAEMQETLNKLLAKSPTEITHNEMMFVLEHMNLEAITAAAMERQNLKVKKSGEEN